MPEKNLAVELLEKLLKDDIRAKLKILVRRTLQRWKYPPDKTTGAIELVLKQAEALSNSWTI